MCTSKSADSRWMEKAAVQQIRLDICLTFCFKKIKKKVSSILDCSYKKHQSVKQRVRGVKNLST